MHTFPLLFLYHLRACGCILACPPFRAHFLRHVAFIRFAYPYTPTSLFGEEVTNILHPRRLLEPLGETKVLTSRPSTCVVTSAEDIGNGDSVEVKANMTLRDCIVSINDGRYTQIPPPIITFAIPESGISSSPSAAGTSAWHRTIVLKKALPQLRETMYIHGGTQRLEEHTARRRALCIAAAPGKCTPRPTALFAPVNETTRFSSELDGGQECYEADLREVPTDCAGYVEAGFVCAGPHCACSGPFCTSLGLGSECAKLALAGSYANVYTGKCDNDVLSHIGETLSGFGVGSASIYPDGSGVGSSVGRSCSRDARRPAIELIPDPTTYPDDIVGPDLPGNSPFTIGARSGLYVRQY